MNLAPHFIDHGIGDPYGIILGIVGSTTSRLHLGDRVIDDPCDLILELVGLITLTARLRYLGLEDLMTVAT